MSTIKNLHPRNKHNQGYDFTALCQVSPQLKKFLIKSPAATDSINFSDSEAVKALNLALLKQNYGIIKWDIPKSYLCPPIPGRADYVHYLADILKQSNFNKPAPGNKVKVLDIGTGASCIYPILGNQSYQWQYIASDIDPISINNVKQIIHDNPVLIANIECRLQSNENYTFTNIIKEDEFFDLTMCNPPFHESLEQGQLGSEKKWKNLNKVNNSNSNHIPKTNLNFGGQKAELWCKGGELRFVSNMIKESKRFQRQVLWFSCLVSKKEHLKALKFALKKVKATEIKIIKMHQGNKITRFIAWTFCDTTQQQQWCINRFNTNP